MKELQKYYAVKADLHWPQNAACTHICVPVYRADEADAAFAEMRREHAEHVTDLVDTRDERYQQHAREIAALKQQHAEEIERLKAQLLEYGSALIEARMHSVSLSKLAELNIQAERYEKLRKLNVGQFQDLFIANIAGKGLFDALVDQLPASGEAQTHE